MIFFLFLIPPYLAQSIALQQTSWQFSIGVNTTSIKRVKSNGDTRTGIENQLTLGSHIFIGYQNQWSEKIYGVLQLGYLKQNLKVRSFSAGHFFGSSHEMELYPNWLDFSYLLSFETDGDVSLIFQIGPYFSRLLNGNQTVAVNNHRWNVDKLLNSESETRLSQEEFFKPDLIGVNSGFLVSFYLSEYLKGNIGIDYRLGFNDKLVPLLLFEPTHIHSLAFNLGVSVSL